MTGLAVCRLPDVGHRPPEPTPGTGPAGWTPRPAGRPSPADRGPSGARCDPRAWACRTQPPAGGSVLRQLVRGDDVVGGCPLGQVVMVDGGGHQIGEEVG